MKNGLTKNKVVASARLISLNDIKNNVKPKKKLDPLKSATIECALLKTMGCFVKIR